jgi:oxygen-independent coproporphyrinogen-3 oxidase
MKASLASATARNSRAGSAPAAPDDRFGIYIHIPFCTHICPYCDFNTYASQASRIPAYMDAVNREVARWSAEFTRRTAGSIFFGGGTPSLLEAGQIGSAIAACRQAFEIASDAEVTIEANPNDLSEAFCEGLLRAGVNRISIGAQTLDRRGLRTLGRLHDAAQIRKAVSSARSAGFANLSLDFIYGWPGQSQAQWQSDLDQVLSGAVGGSVPDHLSLYGLIVEPGTPMADAVHRGLFLTVDDDQAADYYELAVAMLASAGWRHYEISNWCATPSKVSAHNVVYWRNGDYAGIGAGAHGHRCDRRTMNQPSPRRYIDAIGRGDSPVTNVEEISSSTAMAETMMLGLRLLEDGVSITSFRLRHAVSIWDRYGDQLARLNVLGLIDIDEDTVKLTERGTLLANDVCAEFL